jgi:hypothetical protein
MKDQGALLIRGRALATSTMTANPRMPAGGRARRERMPSPPWKGGDRTGSSGRDIPDDQASLRTHGFGDLKLLELATIDRLSR